MLCRWTARVASSVAAGFLMLASAQAEPVKLRMGSATADAPTDVYRITFDELNKALNEVAPGQFELSFFPNRQLGDEKEMVQGLQLGTLDLAAITNSVVANVVPAFVVTDLPFLFPDQAKAIEILDGPLGDQLLADLDAKGVVGLAFCEAGYRHMLNNVRPVKTPSDVIGSKFRVMQSPIFIGMFTNLQGSPVPMAWGDAITAFQQGAIDGVEVPAWVVSGSNLDQMAKFMSLTRHVYSTAPLMMSKTSFNRLSSEQQEALKAAAKTACAAERVQSALQESKIVEDLATKWRMQINEIDDAGPFQNAMLPVYENFRDQIGSERLDAWLAAVKK